MDNPARRVDHFRHEQERGRRFDDEPRPDGEWTPAAVANGTKVVDARAKLIFADGKVAPSEAYGGTRAAV
jgi:hypothetical protein